MKYTFERTTILMIFAIIINIANLACDPRTPVETQSPTPVETQSPTPVETQSPTPVQQWEDWVNVLKRDDLTVVDATESRRWLAEHSEKISLPNEIGFMEQHIVMGYPIIITTDHAGKHRIVAGQWPLLGSPEELSFKDFYERTHTLLSHSESLNWLRRNGYNVSKVKNGYRIIHESSDGYKDYSVISTTGTIMRDIEDNSGNPVTLLYDGKSGKLCIAIPK